MNLLQNETPTKAERRIDILKFIYAIYIYIYYITLITSPKFKESVGSAKQEESPKLTSAAASVSNFRSTNSSRKMKMGCALLCVYTLLAARFLLLVDSSWLLLRLASLQPCALQLPACSSACLGPFPLSFPPPPERYTYRN